jgi:hypothetical protein
MIDTPIEIRAGAVPPRGEQVVGRYCEACAKLLPDVEKAEP